MLAYYNQLFMKKIIFTALIALISQFTIAQKHATPDAATSDFLYNATLMNRKEVAFGKLAGQKGHLPSVRAYGDKMAQHHSDAEKQLVALIHSKHFKSPKQMDAVYAPDSTMIMATGTDFDKMYVPMMVADHKKAIALYENEYSVTSDADIKAFTAKMLGLLKEHLAEALNIAKTMNITVE